LGSSIICFRRRAAPIESRGDIDRRDLQAVASEGKFVGDAKEFRRIAAPRRQNAIVGRSFGAIISLAVAFA
jgi:hypothetical protein